MRTGPLAFFALTCGLVATARAQVSVSIVNFDFNPASVTVPAGTVVTWTNNDPVAHTVTSDTGVFDSGTLDPGGRFQVQFNAPGNYPYICIFHAGMEGTVVVEPACGSADFNCDGDVGTDADIEAFFRCLAGKCPAPPCPNSADFNGDGDVGTDADIEAFFRVLAGGAC